MRYSVQSRFTRFTCFLLSYLMIVSSGFLLPLRAETSTRSVAKPVKTTKTPQPRKKKGGRREGELLVRFKANASQHDIDALLAGRGAVRGKRLKGGSRLNKLLLQSGRDPETLAIELAGNPAVESVEPNYLISKDDLTPNDPRFSEQWALHNTGNNAGVVGADINAPAAWDTTTGSNTTVIAVIDSGIDFTHPDLGANQWFNQLEQPNGIDDDHNGLIDDIYGWNWVDNTNDTSDNMGMEPSSGNHRRSGKQQNRNQRRYVARQPDEPEGAGQQRVRRCFRCGRSHRLCHRQRSANNKLLVGLG